MQNLISVKILLQEMLWKWLVDFIFSSHGIDKVLPSLSTVQLKSRRKIYQKGTIQLRNWRHPILGTYHNFQILICLCRLMINKKIQPIAKIPPAYLWIGYQVLAIPLPEGCKHEMKIKNLSSLNKGFLWGNQQRLSIRWWLFQQIDWVPTRIRSNGKATRYLPILWWKS